MQKFERKESEWVAAIHQVNDRFWGMFNLRGKGFVVIDGDSWIWPLVSSSMAGWEIRELNGGFF